MQALGGSLPQVFPGNKPGKNQASVAADTTIQQFCSNN
jgi:hypothetical protein